MAPYIAEKGDMKMSRQKSQPEKSTAVKWIMNWAKGENRDARRALLLAQTDRWRAELAFEVLQPGTVIIRLRRNQDRKKYPFLGQNRIPEKYGHELVTLVNEVSRVMCVGLRYCEKVYLLSLCESERGGLHLRLVPRYVKDRQKSHDNKTGGITLVSSWELAIRNGDFCEYNGLRVPTPKEKDDGHVRHPWYGYAYEIWDEFNKGLEELQSDQHKPQKDLEEPPLK